ncbi:MAG: ParB/RepB/Spo0J family partition protein [Gammaproteobacteria bacterium]
MVRSKRFRFGSESQIGSEISQVVRQGQAEAGELNVEFIDIERIETDPENSRALGLTEEEFNWLLDKELVAAAREQEGEIDRRTQMLLKLHGLAESVRAHGIQQPIRVYRRGDRFRLVYGERRYWASRVAGLSAIPAWISRTRPARLRSLQLIENLQRDDLDLTARLRNIAAVVEEMEGAENDPVSAEDLSRTIGVSKRQAYKYLTILKGPADIMSAVSQARIRSLSAAADLAGIDDAAARARAISAVEAGMSVKKAREKAISPKPQFQHGTTKGRPATKINLGSTRNGPLVREIIRRFKSDGQIPPIDWSDYSSVTKTWKAFLADLERTLS